MFAFAAATTAWAMGSGPPVIIAQPQSQSVAVGSSVLFQVSAMGEPPLSCQWRFNGVPIAGATSFGLAVTNVTIDNVGAYAALVSNGSGATLSQPAYLSLSSYSYVVQLVPGWSAIANQLHLGSNLINQVLPNVSDGSSLFKFNPAIQDFDPADVFFPGVGWLDADLSLSTTVLAPGQGAFILSPQAISVTFVGAVHPPTGPLALETNGFNLVSARVPRRASYEEITGLAPVAGATVDRWDPSLQNYRTHFFFQGRWTSGSPLAEVGEPLFVSFQPPLLITNQPADAVGVAPGTPVSFFVGAEAGRAPLYYQWRLNGVNIPDATNATLTIADAQPITGGSYQALIRTGHPLLTPTSTKETEAADPSGSPGLPPPMVSSCFTPEAAASTPSWPRIPERP